MQKKTYGIENYKSLYRYSYLIKNQRGDNPELWKETVSIAMMAHIGDLVARGYNFFIISKPIREIGFNKGEKFKFITYNRFYKMSVTDRKITIIVGRKDRPNARVVTIDAEDFVNLSERTFIIKSSMDLNEKDANKDMREAMRDEIKIKEAGKKDRFIKFADVIYKAILQEEELDLYE